MTQDICASTTGQVAFRPYLLAVLAPLLWAGNFAVGHAVSDIDPVVLNLVRWAIAGLALLPLLVWHRRRVRCVLGTHFFALLMLSLLGIVGCNIFVYAGLARLPAAQAGVVFGLTPILTLVVSRLWSGRAVPRGVGLGDLLAYLGVIALFVTDLHTAGFDPLGVWLVLAGATCFAVYTVAVQRFAVPLREDLCLGVEIWIGLAIMGSVVPLLGLDWSSSLSGPGRIAGVIYLGLGASVVAYAAWQAAVRGIGAQRTSVFGQLVPVFGVLMAAILQADMLTHVKLAGICCVLAGICLAQLRCRDAVAPPAPGFAARRSPSRPLAWSDLRQ